jgi:hypothetical protein
MMNNASLESFGDVSFALINHPTNQPMHLISWPTIYPKIVKHSAPFKYLHINKWDIGYVVTHGSSFTKYVSIRLF